MIYLDYSATTPVNDEVLDSFCKTTIGYPGNPNSLHKLGIDAKKLIEASTSQIANILNVKDSEIIYTSGASESNNLAIKGIADKYKNRGKHIITTNFEHSSIYGPLSYLQKQGFDIDFVETLPNGLIDLNKLENLIRDDTILVTVASVNSEIGIRQPIEKISNVVKKFPKCFFHVDMTQSIGKENISLNNIDLISFSAHKFFGMKGIGILVKKEKVSLEPLIHGGKSTTAYRSGTPALPLIVSLAKALRLATIDIDKKYQYVRKINKMLVDKLREYPLVRINSNENCIPQILNISILGCKPETMQHALEEYEIYVSTQTACSKNSSFSKAIFALTNDEERASSSIRISLSYITTEEECMEFLKAFSACYERLTSLR